MDCIFCKIFAGQLDAQVVYKDDETMGIMDANPVARGHVLVITRSHVGEFYELGSSAYSNLMTVIQRLARDMKRRLGAERVNIKTVGEHVPDHVHIHLIPVYPDTADVPTAEAAELQALAELISS